jgi:hypothetical protein
MPRSGAGSQVSALFRGWPLLKLQSLTSVSTTCRGFRSSAAEVWPYSTPVARNVNLTSLKLDFHCQVIDHIHLSVLSSTEKSSMNANNGVQIEGPMDPENRILSP